MTINNIPNGRKQVAIFLLAVLEGRKNLNVSDDTYDRLKKHGQFGESFDELINRILDVMEAKASKK